MTEIAYRWNEKKNQVLKRTRGIGFEDIVDAIKSGNQLADIPHPNPNYIHQRMIIVRIGDYAYEVPYVLDNGTTFFKTLFPSRRSTRKFIKGA